MAAGPPPRPRPGRLPTIAQGNCGSASHCPSHRHPFRSPSPPPAHGRGWPGRNVAVPDRKSSPHPGPCLLIQPVCRPMHGRHQGSYTMELRASRPRPAAHAHGAPCRQRENGNLSDTLPAPPGHGQPRRPPRGDRENECDWQGSAWQRGSRGRASRARSGNGTPAPARGTTMKNRFDGGLRIGYLHLPRTRIPDHRDPDSDRDL